MTECHAFNILSVMLIRKNPETQYVYVIKNENVNMTVIFNLSKSKTKDEKGNLIY